MQESGNNGEKIRKSNELNENDPDDIKNKKNNRVAQALDLPTLWNLNPRSIYNKIDEFNTFVKEEQVDVVFLSESWERDYLTLDQIIQLEDHTVISNVSQRTGMGGRPAIVANKEKFHIQNLTNTLIQIPWGVEAV